MASTVEIFLSYAHKDRIWKDRLIEHLSLLKQQGHIAMWYDQDISAGVEWQQAIHEHLDNAQVILLLISPSFVAAEHCYCREMMRAIERHNAGDARVIPIILRPVDWRDTPFGKLQALPLNGQPIMAWKKNNLAWINCCTGTECPCRTRFTIYFSKPSTNLLLPVLFLFYRPLFTCLTLRTCNDLVIPVNGKFAIVVSRLPATILCYWTNQIDFVAFL